VIDWLSSGTIALMSNAEEGIYVRLLIHSWNFPDLTLPADINEVRKLVKNASVQKVEKVLRMCFARTKNGWKNERLWADFLHVLEKSSQARHAVKCRENKKTHKTDDVSGDSSKHAIPIDRGAIHTETETETKTEGPKKELGIRKKRDPFTPPTVEEVRAFCYERKNSVDAQAFIDHYTNTGWRTGKPPGYPMKDWKAAIRKTWEGNNGRQGKADNRDGAGGAYGKTGSGQAPAGNHENRAGHPVSEPGKYSELQPGDIIICDGVETIIT